MVSLPTLLSTRPLVSSTPRSRPLGIWLGWYICHAPTRPVVAGAGEAVRKGCNGWLTPVRGVADCAGVGDSAAATPREAAFAGVVPVWARFGFVGPFTAIARSTLGDGDGSEPTRSGCDLLPVDAVSWLPATRPSCATRCTASRISIC